MTLKDIIMFRKKLREWEKNPENKLSYTSEIERNEMREGIKKLSGIIKATKELRLWSIIIISIIIIITVLMINSNPGSIIFGVWFSIDIGVAVFLSFFIYTEIDYIARTKNKIDFGAICEIIDRKCTD